MPNKEVPYVIMEYLEGSTLLEMSAVGLLTEQELRTIGLHMAEALSYIHAHEIIHRDVKPSNIHVVSAERTVLLDFGLALPDDATRLTATDERVGTLATMAPEQLLGEVLDYRADIYSLGVTLYQAATGQFPFNNEQIVRMAVEGSPPTSSPALSELRPELPKSLTRAIKRSMAFDKKERFSTCEELKGALEKPRKDLTEEVALTQTPPKRSFASLLWVLPLLLGLLLFCFSQRAPSPPKMKIDRGELNLVCIELANKKALPTEEELTVLGEVLAEVSLPVKSLPEKADNDYIKRAPHLLLEKQSSMPAKGLLFLIGWATEQKKHERAGELAYCFVRTYGHLFCFNKRLNNWLLAVAEKARGEFQLGLAYCKAASSSKDKALGQLITLAATCLSMAYDVKHKAKFIKQGIRGDVRTLLHLAKDKPGTILVSTKLRLLYILNDKSSRAAVRVATLRWLQSRKVSESDISPLWWGAKALSQGFDDNTDVLVPTKGFAPREEREKAVEWLKIATEIARGYDKPKVQCFLAQLLNTLGRQKETIILLKSISPEEIPVDLLDNYFNQLGEAYDRLNRFDEAIENYKLGLKLDPRDWIKKRYTEAINRSKRLAALSRF